MKAKAKVSQLINSNGKSAANQFVLRDEDKVTFQSYETTIAHHHHNGVIVLDVNALNYSKTTSKHLFIFLGMDRKEIERQIKDGVITLQDLNK
jgi:hypothetical protein